MHNIKGRELLYNSYNETLKSQSKCSKMQKLVLFATACASSTIGDDCSKPQLARYVAM